MEKQIQELQHKELIVPTQVNKQSLVLLDGTAMTPYALVLAENQTYRKPNVNAGMTIGQRDGEMKFVLLHKKEMYIDEHGQQWIRIPKTIGFNLQHVPSWYLDGDMPPPK